ncbi:hypothetical protein NQ318_022674 [Aromia moschata]|uniref:DUF4817 domain-containing protein n=1 Tax=Aromia moschata TaxID=1265417 RepID=A0AAV8YLL0_9CUCU|nr:hypothetical protein NQ318_022674 [Aromia moschata]
MAERFTFPEMCNSNSSAAVRRYRQEFPNIRTLSRKMFDNIDRQLRETGTFYKTNRNAGRQRFARNVNVEDRLLHRVWEDPALSTRWLGSGEYCTNKVCILFSCKGSGIVINRFPEKVMLGKELVFLLMVDCMCCVRTVSDERTLRRAA